MGQKSTREQERLIVTADGEGGRRGSRRADISSSAIINHLSAGEGSVREEIAESDDGWASVASLCQILVGKKQMRGKEGSSDCFGQRRQQHQQLWQQEVMWEQQLWGHGVTWLRSAIVRETQQAEPRKPSNRATRAKKSPVEPSQEPK